MLLLERPEISPEIFVYNIDAITGEIAHTRRCIRVSRARYLIPYGIFFVDCLIAVTNASVHHCKTWRSSRCQHKAKELLFVELTTNIYGPSFWIL